MKLPKAQERILHFLCDGHLRCYREIAQATGQHSGLSAELRERSYRGLGSKGMVREGELTAAQMKIKKPVKEKVYTFQITAYSCKFLGVPVPALLMDPKAAEADFAERYRRFHEQYRKDERIAKAIGLRHNPFVLLRALGDEQEHTLSDLTRATGLFSGLPQDLRARHARHRSLAYLGLVRESIQEEATGRGNKFLYTFVITPAGLQLLEKANAVEIEEPAPKQRKGRRRLAPPIPCWSDD